jgi:hypothetical protein
VLAGEAIDVVGHTIQRGLYESSVGRTLADELGPTPRSMLLLQIGSSSRVRPDLAEQAGRWRAAGFRADVQTVEGEETWWLLDERWHDEGSRPMTGELIGSTTAWVLARSQEHAGSGVAS